MVGAAMIASHLIEPIWGYITMLPGALIWFGLSLGDRQWAMAAMQLTFCSINCLGIWRWAI